MTLANIFLPDVKELAERKCVALKFWVGGMTAAKPTRKTHNIAWREEEYTLSSVRVTLKQHITTQRKMKYFLQVLRLPLLLN